MMEGLKQGACPFVSHLTFALEPKLVFHGGAIGTENSFVMTEDGPQYLSITPDVITYVTK
ncbi:hypothetical protein Ga0466249_005147 [Sporomusaceae bacterium BoRhaA]|uniref:hypothetical protein n=1 Tax=Pelorhabdus rhamnosifermentans TaxID=2772457 RepID=UPI001C064317|nr:hypothetical protein [Pelorhabdus rhamnosifermentans]MBU2703995.1 hypothetical protein [Pelorhabdus rhamnosifermentans]